METTKMVLLDDDIKIEQKYKFFMIKVIENLLNKTNWTDNERTLIMILTGLFFSISNLIMKITHNYYPDSDSNNIGFNRTLISTALSLVYIRLIEIKIKPINEIERKNILVLRILAAFGIGNAVPNTIAYLRLGTANAFFFVFPVFTVLFAILFMGEKLKQRNLIGIVLCLLALFLYTQTDSEVVTETQNVFKGVLWGILAIVSSSCTAITTKLLVAEIDSIMLNLYVNGGCIIIHFLFFIFPNCKFLLDFNFILLCFLNGFFFWLALFCMNLMYKVCTLVQTASNNFLAIVYSFIYGVLFYGEPLTLKDIISSGLILGFNLFDALYPLQTEK